MTATQLASAGLRVSDRAILRDAKRVATLRDAALLASVDANLGCPRPALALELLALGASPTAKPPRVRGYRWGRPLGRARRHMTALEHAVHGCGPKVIAAMLRRARATPKAITEAFERSLRYPRSGYTRPRHHSGFNGYASSYYRMPHGGPAYAALYDGPGQCDDAVKLLGPFRATGRRSAEQEAMRQCALLTRDLRRCRRLERPALGPGFKMFRRSKRPPPTRLVTIKATVRFKKCKPRVYRQFRYRGLRAPLRSAHVRSAWFEDVELVKVEPLVRGWESVPSAAELEVLGLLLSRGRPAPGLVAKILARSVSAARVAHRQRGRPSRWYHGRTRFAGAIAVLRVVAKHATKPQRRVALRKAGPLDGPVARALAGGAARVDPLSDPKVALAQFRRASWDLAWRRKGDPTGARAVISRAVKALLTKHRLVSGPQQRRGQVLFGAVDAGIVAVVARLLRAGLSVHTVACNGRRPYRVARGASRCKSLLVAAVHGGRFRRDAAQRSRRRLALVRLLLDKGATINTGHRLTPLAAAVRAGELEIAKLLVARGADPNRKSTLGQFKLPRGAGFTALDALDRSKQVAAALRGQLEALLVAHRGLRTSAAAMASMLARMHAARARHRAEEARKAREEARRDRIRSARLRERLRRQREAMRLAEQARRDRIARMRRRHLARKAERERKRRAVWRRFNARKIFNDTLRGKSSTTPRPSSTTTPRRGTPTPSYRARGKATRAPRSRGYRGSGGARSSRSGLRSTRRSVARRPSCTVGVCTSYCPSVQKKCGVAPAPALPPSEQTEPPKRIVKRWDGNKLDGTSSTSGYLPRATAERTAKIDALGRGRAQCSRAGGRLERMTYYYLRCVKNRRGTGYRCTQGAKPRCRSLKKNPAHARWRRNKAAAQRDDQAHRSKVSAYQACARTAQQQAAACQQACRRRCR